MSETDWLASRFEEHRPHLRAVAYRMLGSLSEPTTPSRRPWLALQPVRHERRREPRAWLTTVVARVSLNMLRSRRTRREEPMGAPTCRTRSSTGPSGATPSTRRCWPIPSGWPVGRARHPDAAGAPGLRPPRHLRGALRRDRADRRPHARGGAATGQPGPAPRPGRADACPTPTSTASARSSTRSWPPRATVTSRRSWRARPRRRRPGRRGRRSRQGPCAIVRGPTRWPAGVVRSRAWASPQPALGQRRGRDWCAADGEAFVRRRLHRPGRPGRGDRLPGRP